MADESKAAGSAGQSSTGGTPKESSAKPRSTAAQKAPAKSKPKSTAKKTAAKSKAKPASKAKAKKAAASKPKKAAAKKSGGTKKAAPKPKAKSRAGAATAGLDKSVAQFRENLEHSVTLSRDRIQEVVDDAVQRGRMTRGDAEKMVRELIKLGKKQTDSLLGELEKLARQARRKLP